MFQSKRILLVVAPLVVLSSLAIVLRHYSGQYPPPVRSEGIMTDFKPELYALQTPTPDKCAGASTLAMASYEKKEVLATLEDTVINRGGTTGGKHYLDDVLKIAQDRASQIGDYERGGVEGRPGRYGAPPPALYTRMLPPEGELYSQPVAVSINGPDFGRVFPQAPGTTQAHQVVVHTATRTGDHYTFYVSDPAGPTDPNRKLEFDGEQWIYRYDSYGLKVNNDQIGIMSVTNETREIFSIILQGLREGWTVQTIRDATGASRTPGGTPPKPQQHPFIGSWTILSGVGGGSVWTADAGGSVTDSRYPQPGTWRSTGASGAEVVFTYDSPRSAFTVTYKVTIHDGQADVAFSTKVTRGTAFPDPASGSFTIQKSN